MFVVVLICSIIQITSVFPICICYLFKIIADTVWIQVAFQFTDILIDYVNGSYHVIFKPLTVDWITGESQITTVTWRTKILTCSNIII